MMLNYLLAAGIGAMSSILANKNVAVYNDGFRPVYAEYFNGRMDRKSLAATSFAVSFGLTLKGLLDLVLQIRLQWESS